MNWLVELLDKLLCWFPRPVLLDPTEGGLRLSNKKRKVLEGGQLYWHIPLLQEIKTFPVVEQTTNLPPQTLVLANKKALVVSGMLAYEVRDVEQVLTGTHDVDEIIRDVSRAVLAEMLTGQTLQGILDGVVEGTVARRLTTKVRARLKRYGIHVLRAGLHEISPCTVVRIVGENGQTVLPQPDP